MKDFPHLLITVITLLLKGTSHIKLPFLALPHRTIQVIKSMCFLRRISAQIFYIFTGGPTFCTITSCPSLSHSGLGRVSLRFDVYGKSIGVVNRRSFVNCRTKLHRRQPHKSQFASAAKQTYWDAATFQLHHDLENIY